MIIEPQLIPENSYSHKCGCGVEYLAPKGSAHCHKCLYDRISQLEQSNSHSGIRTLYLRSQNRVAELVEKTQQMDKLKSTVAELKEAVNLAEKYRDSAREQRNKCVMRIRALELEMGDLLTLSAMDDLKESLAKFKLEQQIKALTDLHDFFLNEQWDFHGDNVAFTEIALKLDKRIKQVRNSAKGK